MTKATLHQGPHNLTRRSFLLAAAAGTTLGTGSLVMSGTSFADTLQSGGTLRLGLVGSGAFGKAEAHSADGDAVQELYISRNIFEPLTTLDSEGKLKNVLAESFTADDDSGTVWTIKLKPGVEFHNGKILDADDVIASLKRIAMPGTIAGGNIGPVSKYESIDKLTVRLTLGAPRSWLAEGLSDPFCGIVPVDFDPAKPAGTGPFKLGAVNLQQSAELLRHKGYHGTPPMVDSIIATPFADPSAASNALTAGQIDLLVGLEPYLVSELEGKSGIAIYKSPTGRFFPIQMRTDVAPFSDVRLRQALRLVIDRQAVIDSAYGGYASKGNDLYSIYDRDFASDLVRERDVEKARQLIKDANLEGTTLDLAMNVDMATALILAENAKEIGLTIKVKQLDGATFYGEEYFTRSFFGGDYYPNNAYFVTSGICDGPNPSLDQVRWRDEEYHKLWLEASGTLDPGTRHDKLHRMQEILFEKGAWIIPAFGFELAAYSDKLAGLPEHDVSASGVYRAMSKIGFKQA